MEGLRNDGGMVGGWGGGEEREREMLEGGDWPHIYPQVFSNIRL